MSIKSLVIGGGCFWCTEAVFQEIEGVLDIKSGYSGGSIKNPCYREVCMGTTGHAEVIKISYDSEIVSLHDLLLIHMVTHNPTTLNQQGADRGTQYRSIIFYSTDEEKAIAEQVFSEVKGAYLNPIVTELKEFEVFYEAEPEHQNYYRNNSEAGYCKAVIEPKLAKFRKIYSTLKK